jgi:hypothetical protein
MPDASMTALGGERRAARVLRLYKGPPSHAGHTHPPPPRLHTLRARHERPLALQPEDHARRRGVWIGLVGLGPGTGPTPDAPAASTPSFACARFSATVRSTPRPERGEATASTAAPARPRLRAGQASSRTLWFSRWRRHHCLGHHRCSRLALRRLCHVERPGRLAWSCTRMAGGAPILGWAPGMPTPPPGPPLPPIANWPWPQGPFIDLSGDDGNE